MKVFDPKFKILGEEPAVISSLPRRAQDLYDEEMRSFSNDGITREMRMSILQYNGFRIGG